MRKRPERVAKQIQHSVKQLAFGKQEQKRAFVKPCYEFAVQSSCFLSASI